MDFATADAFIDSLDAKAWEDEAHDPSDEVDTIQELGDAESVGEAAPVTALSRPTFKPECWVPSK